MHNASDISDMNIKSIINYSKFKELHLNKKRLYTRKYSK